jgi:hypothetical protein
VTVLFLAQLAWLVGTLFPTLERVADPLAAWVGLAGALAVAFGLWVLTRSRHRSAFVALALVAWLVELGLRGARTLAPAVRAATGDAAPEHARVLEVSTALRLVAAALAMWAFARGVRAMLKGSQVGRVGGLWALVAALFVGQLVAYAILVGAALGSDRGGAPGSLLGAVPLGLGEPLAWIVFALPFAALYVALLRTERAASATATVTDVWIGPG